MLFLSISLGLPFSTIREMSSAELSLYMAYYRIEPWGEERADLRNAMQLHQQAELYRDRKRQPQPYKLQQFMPFHREPELTQEELRDKVRRAFGKGK